jgi:heat-inducible transcriptional repressor
MEQTLPNRTIEVLHSIVQSYIETGEPVASRAIARRRKDNLSAATIRNIMADLADHGYLDQPHTSAGRVPTAKAFRHFARAAAGQKASASDVQRLRDELVQHPGFEERAEHTSHVLTALTRNIGIVAAVPTENLLLDKIELIALPDARVLMVVVTRDGMVRNQVASLAVPVSQDELFSIRNYVNQNFGGWSLHDVRRELNRRLQEERAAYDRLLTTLNLLYGQGLLSVGVPHVYMDGASNLVGIDLHLTKEKLRDLFRALEEKRRLLELLEQFLHSAGGDLFVEVGLENAHPALREFAIIGMNVDLPGGMETRLAVLGPMRMDYHRIVSAVTRIGEALKSLPQ